MSASALTRPGERDRPIVKFAEIDWLMAMALCMIAGIGGILLYSIAGDQWGWAGKQLAAFGAFFFLMIILAMVDLRIWFAAAYPLYVVALVLLVAVDLVGHSAMGAQRWLGTERIHLQPSEVMKVGLVLALARYYHGLSADSARLSWRLVIPILMILLPAALVAKEPDLGTALLIVATGAAVMMLAGLSWKIILSLAGAAAAMVPVLVYLLLDPNQKLLHGYQLQRIMILIDPSSDPQGAGYNIRQSIIALGSGGLLGRGLGMGSQAQGNFLPEKHTDFIFASLAEAFGFAGCFTVLFLYGAIIFMALRIAALSHSHFGRLGASGMTVTFTLYILINGAMVMGMAPVVGVPMPLLSYGGTVALTVMVAFGFVQAVKVHRYSEITSGRGSLI
ncbi:MAG: rod shape-determining protein RodA [Caulobacteraceae bacterium]|nr:rod shape-determining protein RodA [Caulobacteraceae bacterium]